MHAVTTRSRCCHALMRVCMCTHVVAAQSGQSFPARAQPHAHAAHGCRCCWPSSGSPQSWPLPRLLRRCRWLHRQRRRAAMLLLSKLAAQYRRLKVPWPVRVKHATAPRGKPRLRQPHVDSSPRRRCSSLWFLAYCWQAEMPVQRPLQACATLVDAWNMQHLVPKAKLLRCWDCITIVILIQAIVLVAQRCIAKTHSNKIMKSPKVKVPLHNKSYLWS